ncbi:uncharacterized protein LOC136080373 [Hydra vulgaris]|uniref:Uncharacterized protein LOC136080373 n=1 Tax=Hydra vulgaris TaxID=6087 RepID=A0ABM4BV39_HYDVU
MIEVARFLRSEAGRKSVESGFNIKLIENNEIIGNLFNCDKLPLLLKLKESEELVEKDTPIVYCNDIEELVAMVLHHRSQETNDVDIKLGVDGGQGFLKVTLSITLKPELKNNKIPEKLSKSDGYACKDFKDSSVHKTIILAILPSLNEKYHNLRLILDKLNVSSLDYTVY